jgi:hypothetical protein
MSGLLMLEIHDDTPRRTGLQAAQKTIKVCRPRQACGIFFIFARRLKELQFGSYLRRDLEPNDVELAPKLSSMQFALDLVQAVLVGKRASRRCPALLEPLFIVLGDAEDQHEHEEDRCNDGSQHAAEN